MGESAARIRASSRTRSTFLFLWAIAWVAWSHPAFSDPVPIWSVFDTENSDLPSNYIDVLAAAPDGALWVGTFGGGLGYLMRSPTPTHEIVDVIGDINNVTQTVQTFAVIAFDHSQLTQSAMFRYAWRLTERGWLGDQPGPEVVTRSPVFTAQFKHDATYQLSVAAIDRYGIWSKPKEISFSVALPKPNPLRDTTVSIAMWIVSTGVIYFLLIFPLIILYPRFSWARTATNSGVFTKFPFLHQTVLGTSWARAHLFRRYVERVITAAVMPAPYIPQFLFAEKDKAAQALTPDGSGKSLTDLFAVQRRVLPIARSGTGKSVFLRHLVREVGTRFLKGERTPLPVLIDLRTHVLTGRAVQDLVLDVLRGGGIELSDLDLSFLIGKGGFLILVDSLNELTNPVDAQLFHTFFNRDAYNRTLIASQLDLIHRDDVRVFNLAEVTPQQAAKYLEDATGEDIYPSLPLEAQALTRNPQDLAMLAEIAKALGAVCVPIRRAELYSVILDQDGSLHPWVEGNDPRLATVYALAYRMIAEQRVLPEDQLRDWIAAEPNVGTADVVKIVNAIQASRLFRTEVRRDVLGREQPLTGFSHELIGKFLAARHLRRFIVQGSGNSVLDYLTLSGDELWLDIFYFVIDEIDSTRLLNQFLTEILAVGGPVRGRIAAYAIGTKSSEQPDSAVRSAYAKAKLAEDLALTPAG